MKKVFCSFMVLLLVLLPSTVFAQEESSLSDDNKLSLGQYSDVFSEENLSTFLSLDDYNSEYSNNQDQTPSSKTPPLTTENAPPSLLQTISPVKYQTKDIYLVTGTYVGYITLQYQTWILGGRPQFIYDRCYHTSLE